MKKNILIVITQAENAGAQKAVLKLYDYLKNIYNVKIVYLFIQDEVYYNSVKNNYNVTSLMKLRTKRELLKLTGIREMIKKEKIDLIFTYTHWSNILIPILLTGISINIVANKRGALWKYPKIRYIESLVLKMKKMKKIICVSKSLVNEAILLQKIRNDMVLHIPNGITCDSDMKSINKKSDTFDILFVGRLHGQKGIEYLLEGFKQLINAGYEEARLTICGNGILKEYIDNFILENELNSYINLMGNVKNISDYYSSHDVLISTSLWEGFPNVLLEAACYEIPIIATNIDGNLELIEHEKTGYIISSADSKEVFTALELVLSNIEKFKSFSINLKNKFLLKYDDEIIKKEYLKVIDEIINK